MTFLQSLSAYVFTPPAGSFPALVPTAYFQVATMRHFICGCARLMSVVAHYPQILYNFQLKAIPLSNSKKLGE